MSTLEKYGVVYTYKFNGMDYVKFNDYTALYAAYEKLLNGCNEETEPKQTARLTIYGRLTGLNEYTLARNSSRYKGNTIKQQNEVLIMGYIMEQLQGVSFEGKVHITYKWHEKNRRRDQDNIAFAKKFIQDALVKSGVLANDGWKHVVGFTDEFYIDKDNPRIEVIIREV